MLEGRGVRNSAHNMEVWQSRKAQAANLSITTKSMDAVIGLAAQTGSPRKSDAGDKSAPGSANADPMYCSCY